MPIHIRRCGQPGSRLPHFWLQRGGQRISTIDLTGRYLLLAGTDGAAWMDAAEALRPSFQGLPFEAVLMGKDLDDPAQCYRQAFGMTLVAARAARPGRLRRVAQPAGRRATPQARCTRHCARAWGVAGRCADR